MEYCTIRKAHGLFLPLPQETPFFERTRHNGILLYSSSVPKFIKLLYGDGWWSARGPCSRFPVGGYDSKSYTTGRTTWRIIICNLHEEDPLLPLLQTTLPPALARLQVDSTTLQRNVPHTSRWALWGQICQEEEPSGKSTPWIAARPGLTTTPWNSQPQQCGLA